MLGAALKERFETPIMGTFLLFLVTTNWPIWLMAFSGEAPSYRRISDIEEYLSHSWHFRIAVAISLLATYLYYYQWPKLQEILLVKPRELERIKVRKHARHQENLESERQYGIAASEILPLVKRDLDISLHNFSEMMNLLKKTPITDANLKHLITLSDGQLSALKNTAASLDFLDTTIITYEGDMSKNTSEVIRKHRPR